MNYRRKLRLLRLLAGLKPSFAGVVSALAFTSLTVAPIARAAVETVERTDFGPINGFELYGSGLYWWNSGYGGDEITPPRTGQIAMKNVLGGGIYRVPSPSVFLLRSNAIRAPYQSVTRTADWLFQFESTAAGQRIFRRSISNPGANPNDFSGLPFTDLGAMLLYGNTLFWTVVQGNTTQLRSKDVNGPAGGGDTIEFSLNNVGPIIKIGVIDLAEPEGRGPYETDLILLTAGGLLYRFEISPFHEGLALIASNVTDFALRIESWLVQVGPFATERRYGSKVYATTGVNLSASRTAGHLVSFDLSNGGAITEFQTGDANLQLTGVAADGERVYVTRTPLIFQGGGAFGGYVYDRPNGQILRSSYRADRGLLGAPSFQTIIVQQEGRNLRSDGQWIYWAHQDAIRREKTETPPIQLDYQAIGLEAVQVIQNAGNSIPLTTGSPVFARVYAREVTNTSGRILWPVKARIRGFRNNQPLSPPEAYSWNRPLLPSSSDLGTLRASPQSSLQVDLPGEWFATPGDVQLVATINPTLSVPETGVSPLANNTVSTTVNVVSLGTPCLVFNVMNSTLSNYDPTAPASGFGQIMDRALSLLPVPGFSYFIRAGTINNGSAGEPFSMPADSQLALTALSAAHKLEKNPNGCPDTHWVGMFPAGVKDFNGLGDTPGGDLLIRMGLNQSNAGLPWSSIRGGFALAHELAHNYGRLHIDQTLSPQNCSSDKPLGPWDSYFFDPCTLGWTNLAHALSPIGYDSLSNQVILPTESADLMSYSDRRWTSPQTWARLLYDIPAPAGAGAGARGIPPLAAPAGPSLFVQGFVDLAANSATLLPAIQGEAGTFDDAVVQASFEAAAALPPEAPLRLQLLDANDNLLVDSPAVTLRNSERPDTQPRVEQFMPFPPSAVQLRLVNGHVVLARIGATDHAPAIALNSPTFDGINQILSLDWTATDGDGDAVLCTTQFSPDDGATWQTLRVREADFGLSMGTGLLPGGDHCRLRVLATDGFHTTTAITSPFALPKHGPTFHYEGVRDGQHFAFGETINVRAFAYDAEDGGLSSAAISWSATGAEARGGTGANFTLRGLAPGSYSVLLSGSDSEGNPGGASLTFQVRPVEVHDGAAPIFDGFCADSAYAGAAPVVFRPDLREPVARMVHANGILHVCVDGLPLSDAATSAASMQMLIDADGSRDATAQGGDRGFGVTEDGVIFQTQGDGASMVSDAVAPGFRAQIARTETTWSVELQIPDSLLGGWNHSAAVAFAVQRYACGPFLGGCIPVPDAPLLWPASTAIDAPYTWAETQFGALPAAFDRAPVALASGPGVVSLTQPRTLTLDGSASYDLEGDPLTFAWIQLDGPTVTLEGMDTATPSFQSPDVLTSATLRFQLTVNDGNADSGPAEVSVTLIPTGTQTTAPTTGAGSVTLTGGGASVQLVWPGGAGDVALIQASTDLIAWETIGTNTAGFLRTILFTDLAADLYPYRFYRAVSWTPDETSVAGKALEFDGADDRVEIPHDDALNAFPLTLMAWVKTTQATGAYPAIIAKYGGGTGLGYAIALDAGRVTAWYYANPANYLWDANDGIDGRFIATGQWQHIAYVVDETGGHIYRNGTLVNTHAWVGTPGPATTDDKLRFGAYLGGAGLPWAGQLDEVSLWNRALTGPEIRAWLHRSLGGGEAGLVGYWRLDEAADTILDSTGHGYNGVLLNDATWVDSDAPIFP